MRGASSGLNGSAAKDGIVFITTKEYQAKKVNIERIKNLSKKKQPVFVVDNLKADAASVHLDSVKSFIALDRKIGKKLYENEGKNGVIIITTTKNVRYKTAVPPRDPNEIIYIR